MPASALTESVGTAVTTGAEVLLAHRRDDGAFVFGAHHASPLNTAGALTALHFADPEGSAETIERGVTWLCETQRDDGGWAMPSVPTEPLTTALAAAALHLLAPRRAASAVRAARARFEELGGSAAVPEPAMTALIRQFHTFAGLPHEGAQRRLPLELLLFPGLSRRLLSLRLPIYASQALAQSAHRRRGPAGRALDRLARPRALAIVRDAYEREGATGGFSTDPWLTGLICLGLARSGQAPDLVSAAARWLRSAANPDGSWDLMPLDVTWTNFATAALIEAGHADDPQLIGTREMLHRHQQPEPFEALGCPAGYWGFSSPRSWPMALETAEAGAILLRLPGGADDRHVRAGLAWLTATQDAAGSWSLAVRNSKPGGFGPCPQMTAKVVGALLDSGAGADDPRVVRAVRWLVGRQRPDGSYEAMWYRGGTPGTAAALEALSRAGRTEEHHRAAARARDWLLRTRHPDGSWSTGDRSGPGATRRGTVEETAWALRGLLAAGLSPADPAPAAAARWLVDAQRADGGWTPAPVNEYIRGCARYADDGIAAGLAVRALAHYRSAEAAEVVEATHEGGCRRETGKRETGTGAFGPRETGAREPGLRETGARETGTPETGARVTGMRETGSGETGPRETSPRETGVGESGTRETGARETGMRVTGMRETGGGATGSGETGARETGVGESGTRETGPRETGMRETGARETGMRKTGSGETGPCETGVDESSTRETGPREAVTRETGTGEGGGR
ncbi:prenyltransferase/squalene oxidase repeat-containing protein [Streptomyces sp. GMR22]|uniref:prenyltransferase/squalene oxidase repeat-containing protein n=1 Tax=Streptomyces sp. GMR22 TaxID=2759524 RepID=UPI001F16008D|nr:prenyltransferase/squalene oxidase repeat-containing protein [Streptomyces sp. GMR22]